MKKRLIISVMLLFFTLMFFNSIKAEAAPTINTGIELNGDFNDWEGKPEISDTKHDVKSPEYDFLDMKYIADNDYLYLYVERLAAVKSDPWHFKVIITNAASGQTELVNLFDKDKQVSVSVFDITATFDSGSTLVNVSYKGQSIETTLSGSSDGKELEFRIPLNKVGLDGFNKEVQFVLQSGPDKFDMTDWMPDENPITITTGPSGWQFTSILFFIGVACVAFIVTRKNTRKFD